MASDDKENSVPEDKTKVVGVEIEDEIQKSYIDYAMSVIIGRALPDVRDGLKPVHKRILYAMHQISNYPTKPHKKSARIVGEVLGKFHPHGDVAIYDTMVRMAQNFSSRYMLVDGHGNFGSIDGDSAAAMRYTEARLSSIAMEMLRDLEKETVDFRPNFDESLQEPVFLPAVIPNLLINGSSGIAVGMATNIPPHNLSEVCDGVVAMIDNPDIDTDGLLQHITAPDFPTGGLIVGRRGIRELYETGRGRVIMRARTSFETAKSRTHLIIHEIPYYVNKSTLIQKIAELVQIKKIKGIADIRDESDRDGMRVVIILKRDAQPQVVLNLLYKHTAMQSTFGGIMLALDSHDPVIHTLKGILYHFIKHRKEVITRRTQFDLKKAEARLHILDGFLIALKNMETIIEKIKASSDAESAKAVLMKDYKLSETQATAILNMRLQKLTGLEQKKIKEEFDEIKKVIAHLKHILSDEKEIYKIIKEETLEIKKKYGDKRRTEVIMDTAEIDIESLIRKEDVAITITHLGYAKRMTLNSYKAQKRGGVGSGNINVRDEDYVQHLFIASTHDLLLFFTDRGRVYNIKAHEIPEGSKQARGSAIVNFLPLQADEKITAIIPIEEYTDEQFLVCATKLGKVKKTRLSKYNSSRQGLIAITLNENDSVIGVQLTEGDCEYLLSSKHGQLIRFEGKEVREMGRSAAGVRGIKLSATDEVVNFEKLQKDRTLLLVSELGKGKRVSFKTLRKTHRGGKGIIGIRLAREDNLCGMLSVNEEDDIMITTTEGVIIRQKVSDISKQGRYAQGVRVIKLREGQKVMEVVRLATAE